jgi:hypothetical protein
MVKRLIIFMLFICSANAIAANVYIYSGATGNGSGADWTNAYTQLPPVLDRGASGTTYYIAAGQYEGYEFTATNAPVDGTKVISIKKATVADHGTNTGWNDAYAAQAVFKYSNNGGVSYGAKLSTFRIRTSYITIDGAYGSGSNPASYGFRLVMASGFGDDNQKLAGWSGVTIGGTGFKSKTLYSIKVKHIAALGPTPTGQEFYDPNTEEYTGCIAGQNGWKCNNNGLFILMHSLSNSHVYDVDVVSNLFGGWNNNLHIFGATNATITNNYAHNNHGSTYGLHAQNVNFDDTINCTFSRNRLIDSHGFVIGFHIQSGGTKDLKIYNNVMQGVRHPAGCITSMSSNVDTIISGFEVHHNTLVNMSCGPKGFVNVGPATSPATQITYVYNNLLYNVQTARTDNLGLSGQGTIVHDNNSYLKCTGTYNNADETAPQVDADSTNPFTDSANGDYTLNASNQDAIDHVIGKGKTDLGATYAYDFIGYTRDASPDIGAYESGASDTTAPTVTISTSNSTIITDSLAVTGTSVDSVGVSGCKFRIGSAPDASNGTACTGTTSFSCATSGYASGANTLYVGCYDAVGNYGSDSIIVTFTLPTASGCSFSGGIFR